MTISPDQIARQQALEEEMRTSGIARYRMQVAKALKNRDEASTRPVANLLQAAIERMSAGVEEFYSAMTSGKAGRRGVAYPLMAKLEPPVVAFLTAKVCLDSISASRTVTSVARAVGQAMEDELWFRAFNEQKPYLWRALVDTMQIEQIGAKQRQHKLRRSVSRYEIDVTPWTYEQRHQVGMKCIDLLIATTGAFEIVTFTKGKDTVKEFRPLPETVDWICQSHRHCEVLSPIYLPMIVPPVDWTNPFDGGYLTPAVRGYKLVQTRDDGYLEALASHPMPVVYAAINAVQRTAWQINPDILPVMQAVWDAQSGLGKLPAEGDEALPPFPADQDDKEAVADWKRRSCVIHQSNAKRRSKRIATAKALWVAERFRHEPAIYFPHYCDFRGRLYPRPLYLTPQGADYSKGLLRFAEGKPLGDEGAAWLAVHGANLWGYDKADLDARIRWVEENENDILASAESPLEHRWWASADKPWCFLAFCFEWAGYVREGSAYRSHLPIALDGSCNGLQHFSMMLRDEVGGAAVNLVPADVPQDIYSRVAEVVRGKVCLDVATSGNELAQKWLDSGLIGRKLCKKPVMTLPYGAKQYGMRDGIAEFINEAREQQRDEPPFTAEEVFPAATYIGGHIWQSIGEVVVAARNAMDFLQRVAQLAAKEDKAITWVAPSGFPVHQEYREQFGKIVKSQLGGEVVKLTLQVDGEKLAKKRQASGVSPNFVHSLDSAHLMATVVLASANDVDSFAMIHDSYGTHACDTPVLAAALRQSFVEQYQNSNPLQEIHDSIASMLSPENLSELPNVPPMGTLDAEAVLDSAFFFA